MTTAPGPGHHFAPATQAWFASSFAAPTAAQEGAWASIASGEHTLVVAPTGSGKTLAAFLWSIDHLLGEPVPERSQRCRVLYVSPLKALAVDIERNLRSPLVGIANEAARLGLGLPELTVGLRTGDTPAAERRRLATTPPDILITTPESLFLLLTSKARESLASVQTVIIDEVHAVAATKRGAHLALSLERLDALLATPAQRIGLSATVRPVEAIAGFMCPAKPARIVAPPSLKQWDLRIQVPVEDMADIGASTGEVSGSAAGAEARTSIWPHIDEQLVDIIDAHTSTLIFVNSRRLAERTTARINEIAVERGHPAGVVARAHHGSVSREQRSIIEEDLKAGRLPAVVATSSLELGIDMGAIDIVVQLETPPSVASGLQRVGRAGHQVGAVSRGVVFPKFRGDLVTCAVVVEGMLRGEIEDLRIPANPLDVLAQQIVAAVAMDDWTTQSLLDLVRRSASFASLTVGVFESVLDMLSGRYPSDEFAELRPRLVWDRETGQLTARPGAQRLAVTSGGTIPDRGLFAVFVVGEKGFRVGELDEEMVYESRVGEVIALGASSWRIEEITHDRVLVSPAPGQPGRLPFWHGDALGRPAALGASIGAFVRDIAESSAPAARSRLAGTGLDDRGIRNLIDYLNDQRSSTVHVPSDTTIVVERFRDELGDWRVVVHSPYGARVHAPWALALARQLHDELGIDVQVMHADDGIVLRLPDTDDDTHARSIARALLIDPDEIEQLVTDAVGGSALFASRFREAAARALLLPKRRPDRRSPLWQQRQRSAHLLDVAAKFASFPIILETVRECLQDAYDVPALRALLQSLRAGSIQVVEVETSSPSPFARSLLFGYVASFMYEGDSPLAERRAQALTLDTALLAELLGTVELRDLLDLAAVEEVEAELQCLTVNRRARDLEDAADLLRTLGPLSDDAAALRGIESAWLRQLIVSRRAIGVRIDGHEVTASIEDAARLRDAFGAALPPGIPAQFLEPVSDPLADILGRFARTHGPWTLASASSELGLAPAVVASTAARLAAAGRLARGEFRPLGHGATGEAEWCDTGVLRSIRRRSVAKLRHEVEPVPTAQFAHFLATWQHVAPVGSRPRLHGLAGLMTVVEQLAGTALPASAWESSVLPARISGYHPGLLDQATTGGEIAWWGVQPLPGGDGAVALAPADIADGLRPDVNVLLPTVTEPVALAVLDVLAPGAAYFFRDIADQVIASLGLDGPSGVVDDARVEAALWDLTWAGLLTNDSWAGLRLRLGRKAPRPAAAVSRRRLALPRRTGPPTASGRWAALPGVAVPTEVRAGLLGDLLLARHGVVTRGGVAAERVAGGFMAAYRILTSFEDAGRCQRTYAVDGLGAAQFATPAAVDRLRSLVADRQTPVVTVLAAVDPANPYGAALPWPTPPTDAHRPGRKLGAFIVTIDGRCSAFLERGGKTLLIWDGEPLDHVLAGLISAGHSGIIPALPLATVNGASPLGDERIEQALARAGFRPVPSGWRLPRPATTVDASGNSRPRGPYA